MIEWTVQSEGSTFASYLPPADVKQQYYEHLPKSVQTWWTEREIRFDDDGGEAPATDRKSKNTWYNNHTSYVSPREPRLATLRTRLADHGVNSDNSII